MRLELYIRQPQSLEEAIEEFKEKAAWSHYRIDSDVQAYWQKDLFGPQDAFVFASVTKKRKKHARGCDEEKARRGYQPTGAVDETGCAETGEAAGPG